MTQLKRANRHLPQRGTARRGFVVFTAIAALLILMIVASLFLQYGIQSLRQERLQDLSSQCEQIALSLRDLSRQSKINLGEELRPIAIDDLLPPSAEGKAWLGSSELAGEKTVKCRVEINRGRDRLDHYFEWPVK